MGIGRAIAKQMAGVLSDTVKEVAPKVAKPVKSGVSAFSEKALENARKETGHKSRTVLIEMKIDDFLNLAEKGTDESKTKGLKDVTGDIDEVPYLTTTTKDGVAKVTGHEGRHRARRLKELGYDTIPVRFRDQHIRWDSQKEGTFDFEKNWPTKIESEDGTHVGSFPIEQGTYKFDSPLDFETKPAKPKLFKDPKESKDIVEMEDEDWVWSDIDNEMGDVLNNGIDKQFAKGGSVEKDPVSGNEVPKGALPNEVRDDVPAMLSEGEFVIPADVVRYIGLDKLRKMRDQAKKGLEDMDAEGQIGGEPVDMADAFAQGGMATQRMAQTAQQTQQALYTPPQEGQSMYTFNQPKQTTTPTVATVAPASTSYEMRRYQHPDGRVMYVPIIGGVEQIDVPEGFVVVDRAEAIGKDAEEVKTGEDADGEGASAGTGTGVSCPAGTEWNGSECVPVSISDNSEEELMGSSASSIVGDMNDYLNDDELEKIQDDMVWAEVKVAAQALVAPAVAIAKGIAGVKTDAQKELEALQQKAADRTAVVMSEKRTDLDPTQLESFKANMAEVTLGALQNKSTISNEDRQALKADIDARFEVAVENGMDPEVAASLKTQALNGVMVSPAAKELGGIRAVAKPSAAKIAEPNLVQKGIEAITGVNKEVRSEEQLREEVRAEIDKGKSVADAVKTVQETLNPKEARAFEAAKIKNAMAATEKDKDKTATEKAVEADKAGAVGEISKTIDDVVNEVMGVKPEDVKEEASAKGRPDYVSQNIKGAKATTAAANAAKIQAQMDDLAAAKTTSTWQPSGTTTRTSGGGWTTNYTGGGSMTQAAPATAPSTPSTSSQRRGYTPSSSSRSSGSSSRSSSSSSGGYSTGSRGSSSYGGNTSRGYSGGYGGWAEGGLITKKNTKKKKTKKKLGITKK